MASAQQEVWFEQWWSAYWLHKSRKRAMEAFAKAVQTDERFQQVLEATRAQAAEMLSREPAHRPHGASWLNGERWLDEAVQPKQDAILDSIYGEMNDLTTGE